MNVTFYSNRSDEKKVGKSLSLIKSVPCRIKENTSMSSPTIILHKDSLPNWNSVNYMYIDTFSRYYFVEPSAIKAVTGGEVEVGGRIDPLQSNLGSILNITCLVLRQENKYNKYYQDSELPIRSQKTYVYKKVGELPSAKTNILTVDGG